MLLNNKLVSVQPMSAPSSFSLFYYDYKYKDMKVFYHKIFKQGHEEKNHKKYTITEDQVENLINMMNSVDLKDVDLAIKILSNANCNQCYDDVIYGCIRSNKWQQRVSKDGVNKRITRFI